MRTRYSPIAPIAILEHLQRCGSLHGYLLLLAHDVLTDPERYSAFVDQMREDHGDDLFIIMDNSVVELGTPVNLQYVIEAADIVSANCIVTPDVLGSFERTKHAINNNIERLTECTYPLMRIPQGASNSELRECVDWLDATLPAKEGENYWGIPRWVANKLGSRESIVQYIAERADDAQIHLLGMSNSFEDDMHCTALDGVMGIDSANPLVMGMYNESLSEGYRHHKRGSYWDRTHVTKVMEENVDYMNDNVGY